MKGVYLKWEDNNVVPDYKYNSGPIVSSKILRRAKLFDVSANGIKVMKARKPATI